MVFFIQKRIIEIGTRLQEIEPTREHKFLEVGANDGVLQSNTLELEDLGWDGILIEPSLTAFKALEARRKCSHKFNCAIGDGSVEFISGSFTKGSLMGSCDQELMMRDIGSKNLLKLKIKNILFKLLLQKNKINSLTTKIQVKTLSILIEASKIDLIDIMILDIEGYEIPALKGLDRNYHPRIVAIETRKRDALEINDLMLSKGYILYENLSRFSVLSNPEWSKDHQDYLWIKQSDENARIAAFSSLKT